MSLCKVIAFCKLYFLFLNINSFSMQQVGYDPLGDFFSGESFGDVDIKEKKSIFIAEEIFKVVQEDTRGVKNCIFIVENKDTGIDEIYKIGESSFGSFCLYKKFDKGVKFLKFEPREIIVTETGTPNFRQRAFAADSLKYFKVIF